MSPRLGLDAETIVRAAAELADSGGVEQVTLAALAAKLGVRSPSLYNHVSGLQDLRTKLAAYGLELLRQTLHSALAGHAGGDAVQAIGLAYIGFAREHPGVYEMTLRAPEAGHSELERASERILQLIIEVLQVYDLNEQGMFHAVRGLRSILHGFASLEHQGAFGMPLDTRESLKRLIDAYISGISRMNAAE